MTSGQFVNKAHPLFDVGMNREELKERISVVPIYTVTNNKNDIILITSEVQLNIIFMKPVETLFRKRDHNRELVYCF